MPYINVKTSYDLGQDKKQDIKSELAKIMLEVAGKPQEWLMIGFQEEEIYFKGERCNKSAFIDLRLVGSISYDLKQELSASICELLERKAEIPKTNIYIVITAVEGENWGWNGTTF